MVSLPPLPEDIAMVLRGGIAAKELEQKRLLAEWRALQGCVDADCPPPTFEGVSLGDATATQDDAAESAAGHCALLSSFGRRAPVASVDVSSEGVAFSASWDGRLHLFDLANWCDVLEMTVAPSEAGGSEGSRSALAARPTGAAACCGPPIRSGAREAALVDVACVPFAPQIFGIAIGCEIQLWSQPVADVADGRPMRIVSLRQEGVVNGLRFHAQRGLAASIGDGSAATIWEVDEGSAVCSLDCRAGPLTGLCFAGAREFYEHTVAFSGLDGRVHVWDIRRPRQLHCISCPSELTCIECHEGTHLLSAADVNGRIWLWDLRMWKELRVLSVPAQPGGRSRAHARSLAQSPCGGYMAAGCVDGEVLVFDLRRKCRAWRLLHHSDTVGALAWGGGNTWSSSSEFLACASLDGTWSCWSLGGAGTTAVCSPSATWTASRRSYSAPRTTTASSWSGCTSRVSASKSRTTLAVLLFIGPPIAATGRRCSGCFRDPRASSTATTRAPLLSTGPP
mmetsp:Transcript_46713/g.150090  ORF Transcript_46713/g.150090 Transcript_46713/m.150090 type:complete len:509 (-) Transcript_46713:1658-3184(-)